MRRLKVAAIIIAVLAAVVITYVALTDPVVVCMKGGAGVGSGVLVTATMKMNPGGDSGNLTLALRDQTCAYISGADVTSMRPSVIVNGTPQIQENLSYSSLVTNASFISHNGALVSPTNRIPVGGSATGSLGVGGVQVGTAYTMDIVVLFSGNPGVNYAHVTAEVTAAAS